MWSLIRSVLCEVNLSIDGGKSWKKTHDDLLNGYILATAIILVQLE